jgi:DSF synthase
VFNLGGDLALFRTAIERRERSTLAHYGRACVDVLYRWWKNANTPLTTIALVQGEALGGGFECALGSSVIVAEEDARMGFPEVLFNLFPGMGAYSFLSRKVGRRTTEELITSGAIYTARQLYDMGVVDVITRSRAMSASTSARAMAAAASSRSRRR